MRRNYAVALVATILVGFAVKLFFLPRRAR